MLGDVLVEQSQRVGQTLRGQFDEFAVDVLAGEVGGAFAAAVGDDDGGVAEGGGQGRGGGVRDVVAHEHHFGLVEAGEGGAQEQRRALGVGGAQRLPLGVEAAALVVDRVGVVGVGHRVQVAGLQAGFGQAPGHGLVGQLPGGEGHRPFAVLAAAEPLLFGRCDDPSVDDQRRRRVVEDRVDTQNLHFGPPSRPRARGFARRFGRR